MILAISLIVILHAWIDAYQIKQGWHIQHGLETAAYFAACSTLLLAFNWLPVLTISITARAAIFDPALNLMRGKQITYNGAGASIIDRLENKTGIQHKYLMIAYLIVFLLNIIFV